MEEHPLLRELRAELKRRTSQASGEGEGAPAGEPISSASEERPSWMSEDLFQRWKLEFEQAQALAHERLTDYQGALLEGIRSEFEANLSQAKRLIEEIEKNRDELHTENKAATATAERLAQERLEMSAIHEFRTNAEPPKPEFASTEQAAAEWHERLQSEMGAAQTQWNELLQSSLDRGVHRMVAQFSESSQEIARQTEARLSEGVSELRQPLLQNLAEARETLGAIRGTLDEELVRAKSVLAQVEQSMSQMSGVSAQIDTTTRGAVDELNRRLSLILDAQTQEMGQRAEGLTASSVGKVTSALQTAKHQVVSEAAAEIESKLAPHLDRLPEILRQLSSKELQIDESLHLHRERLRQVSESSERELLSHLGAAVAESKKDFDAARQQAAAKLDEDIDSRIARASQAAAGAMEKVSQGFDQEARGRLEALIGQGLAAGVMTLAEKTEDAKQKFVADLEAESSERAAQIRAQLDGFSGELTGRARTQIEQAAEVTATAFGQVLRGMSDEEAGRFTARTSGTVREQTEQLEKSAASLLRNFDTSAESSLARFCQQMQAHLETSVAEGRSALSGEFNSSLAAYRFERETHEKEWAGNLERLSGEAVSRYQERINTAGDSCVVSSVRRLNEHSQHGLESLMRSADQALRESCAKLFDGLAEILRERSGSGEFLGRSPGAGREAAEAAPPPPPNESGLNQPSL
jgi:hypothetical protein